MFFVPMKCQREPAQGLVDPGHEAEPALSRSRMALSLAECIAVQRRVVLQVARLR